MMQRPMNFDLAGQFLAGFGPGEIGLGDDFESPSEILVLLGLNWLDSAHLVALGEATLSKEA